MWNKALKEKVNKETGGGRSGLHLISGTMWGIKVRVFNTIVCLCVGFLPHKVSTSDIFLVIDLFVYKNEVCITRFLVWVFRHEKTGFLNAQQWPQTLATVAEIRKAPFH